MRFISVSSRAAHGATPHRDIGGFGLCIAAIGAGSAAMAQTLPSDQDSPDEAQSAGDAHKVGEVVVGGLRPLLGDKLPLSIQNIPQTVDVVTNRLMREQGVTRLEDALKNVPGITLNAGEGSARGDTVNIRGFSAFNDFFIDGIRDAAVYDRDDFDTESVEVIKGPSATLFGRGSTGGAINQVSKAPTLGSFENATFEIGSNAAYRGTADVDVRIDDTAAFRLNAMAESSHVADRDFVRNRRWGIAPSLSLGLGEPTTLTISYLHQQENNLPDTGIPFLFGAPAAVPRQLFYGLASDRTTNRDDIATLRLRRDINANLTIADTLRYASYGYNYVFESPNFGDDPPDPGTPLSDILVGRDSPSSFGTQTNLTDQLDMTARFATGPLAHTLVFGAEVSRETSDISRLVNPFDDGDDDDDDAVMVKRFDEGDGDGDDGWIAPTPLLHPDPSQVRPPTPVETRENTVAYSQAVYLIDTINIGRHFNLIAAARFDRFDARYEQIDELTDEQLHLGHVDNLFSPRIALVYKPTPAQSLYVSYGTSFEPSAEALTLTTSTANLGPVKAKTYEAGAKTSWFSGGLLVTGAVFRTEVDNAQGNDPDNPTLTILNGNERVEGFELGASGRIGRLELNTGYTYLDGKTIKSLDPLAVGKIIPNEARNAINVWAEYDLTEAWEVGFGGNYLGHRFADLENTTGGPGYVVLNAMTSYRVSQHLTLQVNAINLTNKLYYQGLYFTDLTENHVIPGSGRTVKLTARVSF